MTSNCGLLSDTVVAALTALAAVRRTTESLRMACVRAEMGSRECLSTSHELSTNVHMYVYVCMYVCVYVYVYMYVCVCVYVCMYAYAYVCMYICMCVCM